MLLEHDVNDHPVYPPIYKRSDKIRVELDWETGKAY
jgi:hypothetical protein